MIERRVLDFVDAQNGIERAALALVRELHPVDVVGYPAHLLSDGKNLILRDVNELRIGVYEASDQPRAGDTVDLWMFACHPLARSCPDVAACRQSLLSPIRNAAFQKVRLDSHEAQCSGHALADFSSMNAIGDDLAPARQISPPLFDSIRRAMKRISNERGGAAKVVIAPHVEDDRRCFG